MRGIRPGYGADTGDGTLLGGVRTRAFFLLLHLIFVDVWAQLWPSSSRYHKFLWHWQGFRRTHIVLHRSKVYVFR